MRGVHSVVDDLRKSVFKEVAKLAYEGGDYSRIDKLPYKIVPGELPKYRDNIFLERAIVNERLRLACGLPLRQANEYGPPSDGIEEAAVPEKYYEPPLINIIPFACNGCPIRELRVSSNCQNCLSHPCQAVCPKGAISTVNRLDDGTEYSEMPGPRGGHLRCRARGRKVTDLPWQRSRSGLPSASLHESRCHGSRNRLRWRTV